jgi:hypothetical protein
VSDQQPHGDSANPVTAAFPAALADDVRAVQAIMPSTDYSHASPFTVVAAGEEVTIPYRIYNPQPPKALARALTSQQAAILRCLYTRHHDGYVRQRQVEQILRIPEPWVVPFVVQLVGEYVLEILVTVGQGLPEIGLPSSRYQVLYGQFLAANPDFFASTERRVVSYWSCYHRRDYPDFWRYPGNDLLNQLRSAAEQNTDRRWPRNTPPDPRELHGYC